MEGASLSVLQSSTLGVSQQWLYLPGTPVFCHCFSGAEAFLVCSMMAVWKNTLDVKRKYNNYLSIGEKKQVGIRIEGDLVDFKLELLFVNNLLILDVDERDQVLLVPNGNRFTVLRPATLDVVAFSWRYIDWG